MLGDCVSLACVTVAKHNDQDDEDEDDDEKKSDDHGHHCQRGFRL